MEKGAVNIHLVYVPVVLSCKRKQNANRLELGHWSKHLMEVCVLLLLIASHNKASLVLGDVPSRVALVSKHHVAIWRSFALGATGFTLHGWRYERMLERRTLRF
jgi:hypothetical protein